MQAYEATLAKLHKTVAPAGHVFMAAICVDPAEQGKGVGKRLMRATQAIAAKLKVPCYTETCGKKKPIIFGKFGYKVKAEEKISVDGADFEHPMVGMSTE